MSATLSDLCIVDWGNTNLTKKFYVADGKYLAVSAAGCDGRIGHKEHAKHTPVLSAIGAQCGKMFFPTEDFTAIKNTITLTPRNGICDGHFLYYLVSFVDIPQRGAGQPFISKGDIQKFAVRVPPYAEQLQIARVLAAVQHAIEGQERLIALTAELKKALMHKLFTEGTRGEPLKQTEIGPVPASWALKRCEDLCDEISVGVVVRPRSYYVERGVPAFRSLNVREDRLETDDLVYFSNKTNDEVLCKSKLRAGDVLIVRTGYPGTSCVVPPRYDGANCIDIIFARPGQRVTSNYLSRFFNSDSGKIQATAAKHGLAQQHLNVGAVKRVRVPVPTFEEQRAIGDALATVDAKRDVHVRAARSFGVLFRTLLHQLMTAQIRVHDLDLSALDELTTKAAGAT